MWRLSSWWHNCQRTKGRIKTRKRMSSLQIVQMSERDSSSMLTLSSGTSRRRSWSRSGPGAAFQLDAIEPLIEKGRIRALLGSNVTEITPDRVRLEMGDDEEVEVANDYVFVFAGGVPPFRFLESIGVGFGGG